MQTYSFTQGDYEEFVATVDRWMEKLGMTEWVYEFSFEQLEGGSQAAVNFDCETKKAIFRLTKNVSYDYGACTDADYLGCHEVLHLMLADYGWVIAKANDQYADVVNAHEHAMIHRLEKVL